MRLQGLSPDQATTRAAGNPYRTCQYGESVPTTDDDETIGGRRRRRSGAVASRAAGSQSWLARSIRFMPDASPGSSAACPPLSTEARNELTMWIRAVRSYAAESRLKNRRM